MRSPLHPSAPPPPALHPVSPPSGPSSSLKDRVLRAVASHLVGYLGSTQQTGLIAMHFGWVMLLGLGFQESGGTFRDVSQAFFKVYAALGGVDENGHGDEGNVLAVWANVSLGLYGLGMLIRRLSGPFTPWSGRQKVALSTGMAGAGYGLAFSALPAHAFQGDSDWLWLIGFFVVATAVCTVWALGVGRVVSRVQERIRQVPPGPARAVATHPRPLVLLGGGLAVMALGIAVGLAAPRAAPRLTLPPPPAAGASQTATVAGGAAQEQQCQQGDAQSCQLLAERLEHGIGLQKDPARAAELMRRGCELGNGLSCAAAAARLERGAPTRADLQTAETLYRRGCELKSADACAGIGYLFQGVLNGPAADPAESARHFARACALGKSDVCGLQ